jgi:hypothetical protein
MSYLKEKTIETGFSGNYWTIYRVNNIKNDGSEVVMVLYKDQATYEAKKLAGDMGGYMAVKNFHIDIPKETFLSGDVYEYVYLDLKTNTQNSEAVDEEGNPIPYFADAESV